MPSSRIPHNPQHPTTRALVAALRGPDRVLVGRRTSPLRLTFANTYADQPIRDHRLLFAISRHVGNAVCRNRCRRRVRAAFSDVATERPVPEGAFLFRPTAAIAELPYSSVTESVSTLLDQLDAKMDGVPSR